jgi:hypothetical protein
MGIKPFVGFSVIRLIAVPISSWLLGVAAYIISLYTLYGERIEAVDLEAVLSWSALALLAALLFVYLPVPLLLRRLMHGCEPVFVFALFGSWLFVIPTTIILLAWGGGAQLPGSLISPESWLFHFMFIASGASFGVGFVYCHHPGAIAEGTNS